MLFAIPSVAQNTKCFKGELMAFNSPYVIYCTHSDSEEKEKNVHFWNSKTNQTDSLFSIEAKVWNDILYYCDNNTIKKREYGRRRQPKQGRLIPKSKQSTHQTFLTNQTQPKS